MITENLSTLKIHKLTQEQYNREREAGTLDETALYLTPDEDSDLSAFLKIEDAESTYETQDNALTKLQEAKDYVDEAIANSGSGITISPDEPAEGDVWIDTDDDMNEELEVVLSFNGRYGEIVPQNGDYTAEMVGADSVGSAASALNDAKSYTDEHNVDIDAHEDIRDLINELTTRLNTLADSDDTTLDQMAEVVSYIKNNKSLIDGITTNKINVSDIINNLTTNVSDKPLSAAQGVALKALIDAIVVPSKTSQLTNDSGYITSFTETDPTVPAWAKAASKPSYTYSEVGAAASSHNHGAGNITSGTLAVARGGTGVTANPSMLVNLGSTTAASVFAASPRPGVTGTLPVANGGTGATTAAAARTNLGAAPTIQYGTADVTAGAASSYAEGTLYVVVE